jgi:hypothetical protein
MKVKTVTLFSGCMVTMVASVALWQLVVVALLVHGVDEVIAVFGRLL